MYLEDIYLNNNHPEHQNLKEDLDLRSRRGGRRKPLPQDVVHHMAGNPLDGGDSAHSGVRRHHEQGL